MVKFPTNGQPQVFRALIAGTSPVAVERPETIQYFNNMVRRRRASSGIRVYGFFYSTIFIVQYLQQGLQGLLCAGKRSKRTGTGTRV